MITLIERSGYLKVQKGLRNNKLRKIDTDDPVKYLAEYSPQVFDSSQLEIFKKDEALYFISGSIKPQANGSYVRNNESVENRDLIIIDYDDLDMSGDEFKQHVSNTVGRYRYITYPTVSNGIKGTRYRFVIEPERPLNKLEFEQTFKKVTEEIGLNADFSSSTFSQIQGLPAHSTDVTDYEIIYNEGIPYPVAEVIQEEEQPSYTQHSVIQSIPEDELDEMVANYIEADWENIKDEGQYVNLHYSIIKDVQEGLITQEQAFKYVTMLANGNEEWENNNHQRLNNDLRRNVNVRTQWSFISKVKLFSNMDIESTQELKEILRDEGNVWREQHRKINAKTGEVTTVPVDPRSVANILEKHCKFVRISEGREKDAFLAVYDYSEGIYKNDTHIFYALINDIEYSIDKRKSDTVIHYLSADEPNLVEITKDTNLIVANNGILKKQTRELMPFSSKYIFISKIATNLNNS
ncbi:hypothetical protein ACEN33_00795 [Ruoffia sp. FAM 24228]|uniref:hypothetical protein n=1 Tax=Ruoffia sp. FAM 24228 TaxID=3259517 RepID=UPI0038884935